MRHIILKELRDMTREKTIVTAFLVQALLAGFSALLLTGLTALHSPEAVDQVPPAEVAFVGATDGSRGFGTYLDGTGNLDIATMTATDALTAFREGRVDMVVQEAQVDGRQRVNIILPAGDIRATLWTTQAKELLLEYEQDLRVERQGRLAQQITYVETGQEIETHGFVYGTLLPILTIAPVFLGGAIAGDAIGQEARSRTLLLLRAAPITAHRLVAAKLTVPLLLVPVQVGLWLGLMALNGFPSQNAHWILLYATAMGAVIAAVSTLTASLLPGEAASQAVTTLGALVLAAVSLIGPRDPLNTIALLATGVPDHLAWWTLGATVTLAISAFLAAGFVTTRRLLNDQV